MKGNIAKGSILLLSLTTFIWVVCSLLNPMFGFDARFFFSNAGETLSRTFTIG